MAEDAEKTRETSSTPQTAEDFSKRGWLHLTNHEYEEAVADFQEALKLNNDLLDAAHGLGKAYLAQDKVEESNQAFDKTVALLDEGAYEQNAQADMLRRLIASSRNTPPPPIIPKE